MGQEKLTLSTDEIIDKYADMVYRLALTQTRNTADAEDIFQEVFVRLVKHRHKLQTEEHVKAWLIRVTINCSKKHFASFWNKNVSYMEEEDAYQLPDVRTQEAYDLVETGMHPVSRAVQKLPEKYRAVIHLFYYEELSVLQIGRLLGEKETTVKSQLHRAREMLRKDLDGGKKGERQDG